MPHLPKIPRAAAPLLLLAAIVAVLILPLLLAASGCTPHGPINWPDKVQCLPGLGDDIAPTVSRILIDNQGGDPTGRDLATRARDELGQLGLKHGTNIVSCLVQRFVHDWTAPGASQDPVRVAAADRGRDFLADVGTTAELPPEDSP